VAIVVSDTSPIRALSHLGRLALLRDLFTEVLIPPAVADELERPKSGLPPLPLAPYGFIRMQSPADLQAVLRFQQSLDLGESQAIALAIEIHASTILIDEKDGSARAWKTVGAVGILLRGKQRGLVAEVRPLLDRLERELNFFISPTFRREALKRAGELTP
jgi:uncharacterized protein